MTAWIRKRPAAPDEAVEAGGRLLGAARMALVAGLVCDADAIRGAYGLAQKLGAALDAAASPALYADLGALAGAGAMTTTPAELTGRADVVLAIGAAGSALIPDLSTRPSRGRAAGKSRSVAVLGDGAADDAVAHVKVEREGIGGTIGTLRALVNGRGVRGPVDEGLRAVAKLLPRALFGVAVYDPAEIGELAVEMLQGLVKDLNQATRFSSLAVTDELQGRAVLQVGVWTTGDGPRVALARGYPEHDPWRFDADRLIASGEVDAVLWLASLAAPRPDWLDDLPSVAILGEAAGDEAEVVIEVAAPGADAAGTLWDARRATLVHQAAARETGKPTAAAVLAGIGRVVDATRNTPC